jgi:hypothetical protein
MPRTTRTSGTPKPPPLPKKRRVTAQHQAVDRVHKIMEENKMIKALEAETDDMDRKGNWERVMGLVKAKKLARGRK